MVKKSLKEVIADLVSMMKAHQSPHEIALGVSIGVFIAVLPVYGFHTILCLAAVCVVRRANKIAVLLGTNISLPPTIAFITWTAYDIGRFILPGQHYPPLSWEYIRHFQVSKIHEFYYPLFIGSLVLGIICAGVFYVVTYLGVRYFRNKRFQDPGIDASQKN